MTPHSNEEVENARIWAESSNFPKVKTEIGDMTLTYYVLPNELCPDLPTFAWMCANQKEGVYGISESVPEEYRVYAIAHEVIESQRYSNQKDGCRKALEEELTLVPDSIKMPYMFHRIEFFRNLIDFSQKTGKIENMSKFRQSLDILENLVNVEK